MDESNNNRNVAGKLASIETMLEVHGRDLLRLETRLLGDGSREGEGLIGAHDRRLAKLEVWFIRVTTGVIVWTFMTGSGPVSLASVVHLLVKP